MLRNDRAEKRPCGEILLPPGHRRVYSVAGLGMVFEAKPDSAAAIGLPPTFKLFESSASGVDLSVVIGSWPTVNSSSEGILYSGAHWRCVGKDHRFAFEFFHPPTSRVYLTARAEMELQGCEITFDESNVRWLYAVSGSTFGSDCALSLPYPLEQLLVLTRLVRSEGFLVHACAAVVDGRALVFAGHSGDGKSTLAAMLAAEGLELLGDERIALRKVGHGFLAYGTPWPGTGGFVSPAAYPLGGIFLLRKADRHMLHGGCASSTAAELLARSIVPYYLPEAASRILSLIRDLTDCVAVRELRFSLEPGLVSLLSRSVAA
jgi:hypothetical protein